MSAIRVPEPPPNAVIFGEKERGVSALDRILEEQLVHRFQESLRMFQGDGALAEKICLEIRHQESRGNSFACDVTDYQPQTLLAEIQKIIVIAAYLAGLHTNARVVE